MKRFTTETPCPDTTRCWEERSPETACTAGRLRGSTPRGEVTAHTPAHTAAGRPSDAFRHNRRMELLKHVRPQSPDCLETGLQMISHSPHHTDVSCLSDVLSL